MIFIGCVVILVEYVRKRKQQAVKNAAFVFETVVDLLIFACLSLYLVIPQQTLFADIISIALLVIIVIKVIFSFVLSKRKK